MNKGLKRTVRLSVVIAILFLAFPVSAGVPRVTICHFPPGNPENAQTITIGLPAVAPHVFLHGDTVGACDDDPQEE